MIDYILQLLCNKFCNENFLFPSPPHGTFNGAMRLAQGGKFHHGFLSGFVSSLGGSYMDKNRGDMTVIEKIAISAAIGGTAEALGGGKFANGAVTGAYVMAFNHLGEHFSTEGENRNARTYIEELKGIRHDVGGFIESREEFLDFMYQMAKSNTVEVSGYELNDNCFFVEPWNNNTADLSWTYIDNIPDYSRTEVVAQYHTHPNSSFPSLADARFSALYGKPVYTLGANGNMWRVSYRLGYHVPIHSISVENRKLYLPYGEPIRR